MGNREYTWQVRAIQTWSWKALFRRCCFCCSVASACPTLCDPMDCSRPGFPVHHLSVCSNSCLVMPSSHLILCHLFLLLPSIFPSIRVFSNELALSIRWPNYWSFIISPSNEYSGLISFRIDWFDLLAVQGLSRVFSNTTVWKHQFFYKVTYE